MGVLKPELVTKGHVCSRGGKRSEEKEKCFLFFPPFSLFLFLPPKSLSKAGKKQICNHPQPPFSLKIPPPVLFFPPYIAQLGNPPPPPPTLLRGIGKFVTSSGEGKCSKLPLPVRDSEKGLWAGLRGRGLLVPPWHPHRATGFLAGVSRVSIPLGWGRSLWHLPSHALSMPSCLLLLSFWLRAQFGDVSGILNIQSGKNSFPSASHGAAGESVTVGFS